MRNSRVIAAYKRHTSQHMVLKEDIKKKNYTSFKSVVDVLVVTRCRDFMCGLKTCFMIFTQETWSRNETFN